MYEHGAKIRNCYVSYKALFSTLELFSYKTFSQSWGNIKPKLENVIFSCCRVSCQYVWSVYS